ncbi:MAG: hypothetical protein QOF06_292 [Solirubrobacterales bacterium]|jgi:hypothetical protein|nr:hypothetical protein [Solirubrobacterales bacterium]
MYDLAQSRRPHVTATCSGGREDAVPLVVYLGSGSDRFVGNAERDFCFPGGGNDYCRHGNGRGCWGGRGNDICIMGPGQDGCHGGPGRDRLYGGPQADQLYGGRGWDYLLTDGGEAELLPPERRKVHEQEINPQ